MKCVIIIDCLLAIGDQTTLADDWHQNKIFLPRINMQKENLLSRI
jgi:hypothetical protein